MDLLVITIHRGLDRGHVVWRVSTGSEEDPVLVLTDRDLTALMASIIDQMQQAVRPNDRASRES